MAVSEDDVRHIAGLARLGLAEERIAALVLELNTILEHMEALAQADVERVEAVEGVGASGTPLRVDEPGAVPLARPLEAFAPLVRDGFLLVPRLATHGDAGASADGGLDADGAAA